MQAAKRLIPIVVFLFTPQVLALKIFSGDEVYNIDYEISEDVWVDYSGKGTTFNLLTGGSIAGQFIGYGYANINVHSGNITKALIANSDSRVNFYDGHVGIDIAVNNNSEFNLLGGTIDGTFWSSDNSTVNISGGTIDTRLYAQYESNTYFTGGLLNGDLHSYHTAQFYFSGGTVTGTFEVQSNSDVYITGGTIYGDLDIWDYGCITIYGTDFHINGQSVEYGEYKSILHGYPINEPLRHLTGMLANGVAIDNDIYIGEQGKIILAVPEPLSLTFLVLGAFAINRKRKK